MPTRHSKRAILRHLRGVSPAGTQIALGFDRRIAHVEKKPHRVGDRILPGFIDLQVNGAYGIDVMSASAADLLRLSNRLAHEGVTGWLPTVITSPLDTIERCDAVIGEAMRAQEELDKEARDPGRPLGGANILGMHLEGPFISPLRLGAHPRLNLLPQGEPLERVLRLKTLRLVTLAPEVEGALGAIPRFTARGVAVSLGHSDATCQQAADAVNAGARMFTHVFNAMRPLHHRDPGIAAAALLPSAAYAGVIPDGVHVDRAMVRLLLHSRTQRATILTPDRVALAGAENRLMGLFGGAVGGVCAERGAAYSANGTLAGGIINMLEAVRLTREIAGMSWSGVAATAAANPAAVLRLRDRAALRLRARADLIVLDRDLGLKAVFLAGREFE